MRRHAWSLTLLLIVGAYAGCSKDYITNNITEIPGETGIVGRVTPAEPGIRISAWQAVKVREVTADDSGYFAILGLATGLYEVRAVTLSGQSAVVGNVKVTEGLASAILIRLDAPVPPLILSVRPTDGATGVPFTSPRIYLNTREALNLASLSTSVLITPPVTGRWSGSVLAYPIVDPILEGGLEAVSSASYVFAADSQLAPATLYSVRILPTLELSDGSPWGDSLTFSFTTEPLRIMCLAGSSGHCGDTIIDLNGFEITLRFNSTVNIDSLNLATSLDPEVEGFWYYASYYGTPTSQVRFFYTAAPQLRAEQVFTLTLAGHVGLVGPVGLGADFVATLVTEPVRVVRILPPLGADAPVSTWIEVDFNTAMDHPSAEAAVSVRAFGGPAVAGAKVWLDDYKLSFQPDAPLALDQAYEVLVANTAVSLLGDSLRDSAYSFFRAAY